ncbi:hypothetical protein OHA70_03305 [Kribbella sp. NBC_00382]|uniref:hypothetical protein n=1 Tax=Kribbella sp. NBC_00382 TaxID=2975967 RepID=UPI002E2519FB
MSDDHDELTIPFKLTGPDVELLVVVGGDLEYLNSITRQDLPSHTEVRLAASVLRRLLTEGQLKHLWRLMNPSGGPQWTVISGDIDQTLSVWPPDQVRLAWAGGAGSAEYANHAGLIHAVIPAATWAPYGSADAYQAAHPLPMTSNRRQFSIDAWMNSTSMAVKVPDGTLKKITRAAVIKYIANRKGGVHFDPRRNLDRSGSKGRRDTEAVLLDHGLLRVGHLSGPEYEIVSMAHEISESNWASEITRLAGGAAPEEFGGDPREIKLWVGYPQDDGTGWVTLTFDSSAEHPVKGAGSEEVGPLPIVEKDSL